MKIIRVVLMVAISLLANARAFGQEKRGLLLTAGYGMVNNIGLDGSHLGNYPKEHRSFGPVFGKIEYRISSKIGLGLNAALRTMQTTWESRYPNDTTGWSFSKTRSNVKSYSVLGRFNYYFIDSRTFDVYTGFGVGFRQNVWNVTSVGPLAENIDTYPTFPIGFEATAGLRAFPVPNLGVYAEAGLAKAWFQGGLVLALPIQSKQRQ